MKYEVNFNGKKASVEFADDLSSGELVIVEDTLQKCLKEQEKKARTTEAKLLTVDSDFDKIYPPLSVRTFTVLTRAGKKTIKDVLNCTDEELQNMRNMGAKSFAEIKERFSKYGKFVEQVGNPDRFEGEEGETE